MPSARNVNGPEKQTDWNTINWRKAYKSVRNLRQRIFRASKKGDFKKVRSLQKLMLRSYSNTLVSVRRVTQVNKGKNTAGVDKVLVKTPKARGRLVDDIATFTTWKAQPAFDTLGGCWRIHWTIRAKSTAAEKKNEILRIAEGFILGFLKKDSAYSRI